MLTASQERVLAALRELTEDGWPASVREVGALCGHASPSTTHSHLQTLERLGHAARHPRHERGAWFPIPTPVERVVMETAHAGRTHAA